MPVAASHPTEKQVFPVPSVQTGVSMGVAEYLRYAEAATRRHQYYEGKCWIMPGASFEHSLIATTTRRILGNALEETECLVLDNDMRIHIPASKAYYYPDACIVCAAPEVDNNESLRNPVAILEVLSPSTEEFDQNAKFADYRKIESLEHYLLIEQTQVAVTHHARTPAGTWAVATTVTDLAGSLTITLAGVAVTVPLAAIYRRVFPAA